MDLSNLKWTDLAPVAAFVLYIVVMRVILPKLGVSTWMSPTCQAEDPPAEDHEAPAPESE